MLRGQRRRVREEGGRKRVWVPAAMDFRSLACFANLLLLFLRKFDLQGVDVFLQTIQIGRPRDLARRQSMPQRFFAGRRPTHREYVIALVKQPGQGQLGRRGILLFRHFRDLVDELQVLREICFAEAGSELAEVTVLEIIW